MNDQTRQQIQQHVNAIQELLDSGQALETETPTRDDLSNLCVEKAQAGNKEAVLNVMGKYNAKSLKQVPDDKLGELQTELEKL